MKMCRLPHYVFCLFLALPLAGGCLPNQPPKVHLKSDVKIDSKVGLIIWVDGMDMNVFNELRAAGKLPNITRYIIDRGVSVQSAVASLPTITYANSISFVTGVLPGHHGIPDNVWFDRYRLVYQNYTHVATYQQVNQEFDNKTIYECIPKDFTVTILNPVTRGATRPIYNWASAGVSYAFHCFDTINHLSTLRFELIADLANQSGRWPKLIMVYYSTPDKVGHRTTPESAAYRKILTDVDEQVGNVCQSLEKAGILDRTYITLVTDHGLVNTSSFVDIEDHLRDYLGIASDGSLCPESIPYEQRMKRFARQRIIGVTCGRRRCALHLRSQDSWRVRPSEQEIDGFADKFAKHPERCEGKTLPQFLADLPATDLAIVHTGDNSIRIQSAIGIGVGRREIRDGKKVYAYSVSSGSDPLEYTQTPSAAALMDGQFHDGDAWFAATLDGPRPDVLVQLLELNDSPRSGDITLYSREGWDYAPKEIGGHGGLVRHEIIVPWFWVGPDLPHGASITGARTVDLMPTMLQLIDRGDTIPPNLDGRDISARLKSATTQPAQGK